MNSKSFHKEMERKIAEQEKAFFAKRPALLETLRALVLTDELKNPVILQYEGYGDSGGLEDIPDNIPNEVQDFLWELLTTKEGGWENNDGGRGDIKWDVNTDDISIDHVQYYTDSQSRQYKF